MEPNSGLLPGTASPDITPALGLLLSEYGSSRQGGSVHSGQECRVPQLACGDETIEDSGSLTFPLGDAAMASSPAETFCEIGCNVRQAARVPPIFSPVTGGFAGCVPDVSGYPRGATRSRSWASVRCPVSEGTARILGGHVGRARRP